MLQDTGEDGSGSPGLAKLRLLGSVLVSREMKFLYRLGFWIVPAVLIGSSLPSMVNLLCDWTKLPENTQRLILLANFLLGLAIAGWKSRSVWVKSFGKKSIEFRSELIAVVIFLFFFVIPSSTLFIYMSVGVPLYSFLIHTRDSIVPQWTILVNCTIGLAAAFAFLITNGMLRRGKPYVGERRLWFASFLGAVLPVAVGMVPLVFAEQGFAIYVFVAAFPLVLALLAMQGYSHPGNRLRSLPALAVFGMSIAGCMFGFQMAMFGLFWHLSGTPVEPNPYRTLFYSTGETLNLPSDYEVRWETGFTWMVLIGVFFMEFCPGLASVLTIYRYQIGNRSFGASGS